MNTYNKKEIPEHLQKYFEPAELGLEPTFQEYINKLCDIFDEVKRVLKKEGTCWVNMGDTYISTGEGRHAGYTDPKYKNGRVGRQIEANALPQIIPEKCLAQIPNRFSIEMCNRGWILRNEIIWHKPNCMPSSVKDRFTVDFEKLFFFVKSKKYYFETQYEPFKSEPTKLRDKRNENYGKAFLSPLGKGLRNGYEQGARNKRAVWTITTKPFREAHFATYPEALCETPIKAGCPIGGIVLDPFFGAGTTGVVAKKLDRNYLGIELNPEYIKIAQARIKAVPEKLL